jgi:hypothetical protein
MSNKEEFKFTTLSLDDIATVQEQPSDTERWKKFEKDMDALHRENKNKLRQSEIDAQHVILNA